MNDLQITLVDLNPRMVRAWRASFEQNAEVAIVQGSMLEQRTDAWVSPTNAGIRMDGGLDAAVKGFLGPQIEAAAQRQMNERFGAALPVGCATCVPTGRDVPRFLVSTPTMRGSSDDVSATMNVALSAVAAIQAVRMHNASLGRMGAMTGIATVALPGLGVGTGQVPPEIAADLMWTAHTLMANHEFDDFAAARRALADELGEIDPVFTIPPPLPKGKKQVDTGPAKPAEEDFDDFD